MLTVFMIDGVPGHIFFCKSENFDKVLEDRQVNEQGVMSQELSMETLLLLTEGRTKVFILCLYKPANFNPL